MEPLLLVEDLGSLDPDGIRGVIVSGDSGPAARPMREDWALAMWGSMRSGERSVLV